MLPTHEYALAILVVDSKRRHSQDRVERAHNESIEVYAERVKQHLINLLNKPNS